MERQPTDPDGRISSRDEPVITADGPVRELEKNSVAEAGDHTSPEFRGLPPVADGDTAVLPLSKDPAGAPEEPDANASDVGGR